MQAGLLTHAEQSWTTSSQTVEACAQDGSPSAMLMPGCAAEHQVGALRAAEVLHGAQRAEAAVLPGGGGPQYAAAGSHSAILAGPNQHRPSALTCPLIGPQCKGHVRLSPACLHVVGSG